MGLGDFIRREATVHAAGRRFLCRRPTMRTVLYALDLFADSIGMGLQVEAPEGATMPSLHETVVEVAAAVPARAAVVLATCVSAGDDVDTEAVLRESPESCRRVAAAVVGLVDLGRVVESLNLPALAQPQAASLAEDEGPGQLAMDIVAVAERFGQSPEAVVEWPYEVFLGIRDVLTARNAPEKDKFMELVEQSARARSH